MTLICLVSHTPWTLGLITPTQKWNYYSNRRMTVTQSLSQSLSRSLSHSQAKSKSHAASQARHSTIVFNKGDPFRESTGIRPSLHPTTINAIADALRSRARKVDGMVFRTSASVKPLDVALTAGKIASSAIVQRQNTSNEDGMKLTEKEEQTIAGRVVGVIMRLDDLEATLYQRVSGITWVQKYNEWSTFGVLPLENKQEQEKMDVEQRIKDDPLFAMSRAECLLAIFLATVEVPQLQKIGESVPDGSKIDFLDSDRMEVLLQ